jgi:hypothetical protein
MAAVRQPTLQPRRPVCRACPWLCTPRALCAGARGARDGRQCQAVHAKARHVPQAKRTHLLPQLAPRVEGSRTALAGPATHEEAGPPGGAGAAHGQATRAARQPRQRLEAGWPAPGAARAERPRALTAPASRARPRGTGRGTAVGDHGQRAVDRTPTRILAHAVPNAPGDRAGRSPRARQAQAGLGCPLAAVAEVGSAHGAEVTTGLAAGLPPSVARPSTAAHQQLGLFRQAAVP